MLARTRQRHRVSRGGVKGTVWGGYKRGTERRNESGQKLNVYGGEDIAARVLKEKRGCQGTPKK